MKVFKKCTCCDFPWFTRDEFLQDGNLELVGYQANFCQLELGFILFNHLTCESTIAIPAGHFQDLHTGPVFSERLTGSEVCNGFCDDTAALDFCEEQCECAYVRNILQIIRNWPKEAYQFTKIAQG